MIDLLTLIQIPTQTTPVIVQQAISWPAVVMALIGIVPACIAAWLAQKGLSQAQQNASVAAVTDKKVDAVQKNGDENGRKLVEIHTLTNSNLTAVTEELKAAKVKIEGFATAQGESNRKIERLESLLEQLARNVIPGPGANSGLGGEPGPVAVEDEKAGERLDKIIQSQALQGAALKKQSTDIAEHGTTLKEKLP